MALTRTRPVVIAAVTGLLLAGGTAYAGNGAAPRGDTITNVSGDRHGGFTIRHYNGRVLHPPTLSEATTECSEYHRRVARVRCNAQVRTRYDALGDTKRALRYARTR